MLSQPVLAPSGRASRITPVPSSPSASAPHGPQRVIDVGPEYALIACAIVLVASLALMVLGVGQPLKDKRCPSVETSVILSALIAFLIGAAATILNFAYRIG